MKPKQKLIIIGASYLQVPLIEKANEMGYETHVFAWEDGAIGKDLASFFYPISITEKEIILEHAKKIKPVGIVSIASDLAMPTVNYVADQLGLTGNTLECTRLTTNKAAMRQALTLANIPCPKFLKLSQAENIDINGLTFPLIVKPTDRSGSRGIRKVDCIDELGSALERALHESLSKEAVVEEFITGREVSVEMISWQGEHHFLAITDKVTSGDPYFVEIEQHEPAILSKNLKNKIIELTKHALETLKVEYGASHTELLITAQDNIYVVEVGARMGGDHIGAKLVHLSTGFDFVKGVIDIACNYKPTICKSENKYAGMFYIIPKSGTIKKINILKNSYIKKIEIFVEEGEQTSTLTNSSERLGYVLYQTTNSKKNIVTENIIEYFE